MRILAMDSTAGSASVAVTEGKRLLSCHVAEAGQTHSERLLPMALETCRMAGLTLEDMEAFAVTVGPGSFTGVRIGVATVKGLAFGRGVPCVGVSTLQALAMGLAPLSGILCPVMDARRGEVYNALFRMNGGRLERLCPDRALPLTALREELAGLGSGEVIRLCGDGTEKALAALAGLPVEAPPALLAPTNALAVAMCAEEQLQAGGELSDLALSPVYLRKPQAEREREERLAREKQQQ